jgi:hypothetical protein
MIHIVARVLVGLLLATSGISKLLNFKWFVDVFRGYRILPDSLASIAACMLIGAEMVIGVTLLAGFHIRDFAGLSILLFGGFSTAVLINLLRGRFELPCGCSGFYRRRRIGWNLLARNAGLAGMSLLAIPDLFKGIPPALVLLVLSVAVLSIGFVSRAKTKSVARFPAFP